MNTTPLDIDRQQPRPPRPQRPPGSIRSPRSPGTTSSPPIVRIRARLADWTARYAAHATHVHRRAAFAGIDAPMVVGLYAGRGIGLADLRPGTVVHAVEPRAELHDVLRQAGEHAGIELRLQGSSDEHIDLPDACVDDVICCLGLCRAASPERVVAEVRRVLRPGGRFRFVEHVAADRGLRAAIQRILRRPWRRAFAGCDPHPHTIELIDAAGFTSVSVHPIPLRHSVAWPINTAVWGIAVR